MSCTRGNPVSVVATSAKKGEMDQLLKVCGGSDIITGRTSSEDAEESKPDTDIVTAALDRAEVVADEALISRLASPDPPAMGPVGQSPRVPHAIHPGRLRCSSVTDLQSAPSSRLAGRAARPPKPDSSSDRRY
jgi:hypothetical protein